LQSPRGDTNVFSPFYSPKVIALLISPKYSTQAYGWAAVAYFFSFEVVAGFLLVALFTGIVIMSVDQSRQEMNASKRLDRQLHERLKKIGLKSDILPAYRAVFDILDKDYRNTIPKHVIRNQLVQSFQHLTNVSVIIN